MKITKKEYYLKGKKEKVTCECGSIINKYNLERHNRCKKHIDYYNKIMSNYDL
jgi:hypothetical protein